MLVLNPAEVDFDGTPWSGVTAVTVDRVARPALEAWGGAGPHAALVDAPSQAVTVRVVSTLTEDDLAAPPLGASGVLSFEARAGAVDTRARTVRVDRAVVTEVRYAVPSGAGAGRKASGASRTVVLVGMSADGAVDPVTVTETAQAGGV